jgi:predicted RNA-binding protein with PUA-like domain
MSEKYWLMKSEPDVFSLADLRRVKHSLWDGVRNYQARNFMMNDMKIGDTVLFYHSNAEPSGIAGLARVSAAAVADPSQFDRKNKAFDEKARKEKPTWYCVEVEFVALFPRFVALGDLRAEPRLGDMLVLRKGQRLSIQPVEAHHARLIIKMGQSA